MYKLLEISILCIVVWFPIFLLIALFWRFVWPRNKVSKWFILFPVWMASGFLGGITGLILFFVVVKIVDGFILLLSDEDAETQYNLGLSYAEGLGGPQNFTEAVKLYKLAASKGLANAQYNLGFCYFTGQGVLQNYMEAIKWYKLAAEQGLAEAQNNLGLSYAEGLGVSQNFTEAVKWFKLAAAQGNAAGMNGLAVAYYDGKGIIRDTQKACQLFKKASEQGDSNAIDNYNRLCAPR